MSEEDFDYLDDMALEEAGPGAASNDGWFGPLEAGAAFALAGYLADRHAEKVAKTVSGAGGGGDGETHVEVHVHPEEEPTPKLINAAEGKLSPEWDNFFGQEPLKRQLAVHIESAKQRDAELDHTLLASGMPGVGKGHDLDTLILTPGGWERLGDLTVGEEVVGSDGRPTKVAAIYDRGVLPLFKVTFSDGSSVRCDADHLWQVQTPKQRHNGRWQTLDTATLASQPLVDGNGRARWYIPMAQPIEHNRTDLPVEPYLAGVMLANADFGKGVISLNKDDRDIAERIETPLVEYPTTTALRFRPAKANEIIDRLGQRNLPAKDKFVPQEYLTADLESRREVLAGLLDCDGGVRAGRGSAQFHTTSPRLAVDVRTLIESLGGTARIRTFKRGEIRVDINLLENPFRSKRKGSQWHMPTRGPSRSIASIEYLREAEVRCIKVDAEDSLYVTQRYIVTHNTTIARIIANEMGSEIIMLVPPFHPSTLNEAAMSLPDKGVLFIDEIHKLADHGKAAAENLLHMLEERRLYLDEGAVDLNKITVIGATTDADKLPETVIDRFPIKPYFQPYSIIELAEITARFQGLHEISLPLEVTLGIARACRGTPRVARELIVAARDLTHATGRVPTVEELLDFKETDADGMTRQHKAYLKAMLMHFKRVTADGQVLYVAGEYAMRSILRETRDGLYRLERFLMQRGYLDRSPQGRRLTDRGIEAARRYLDEDLGRVDVA